MPDVRNTTDTAWTSRPTADDTSFNRLVLKADVPTIALFVASWCEYCEPCCAVFERLAMRYAGRVNLVTLDLDESRAIAESFGIQAVPTYMLFRGGEPFAHGIGYLPESLLDLFLQRTLALNSPNAGAWQPTEQEIEDALLLPMLLRWGWACQRQHQLTRRSGRAQRGVVDMLVSIDAAMVPLTLFENKRRITDSRDLQRATKQALGYALSLSLPSFVVADATRLWVYQVHQSGAILAQRFAWFEIEHDDSAVLALLLALGRT
jgi:thioredoxin-like negative regulator of GroEL